MVSCQGADIDTGRGDTLKAIGVGEMAVGTSLISSAAVSPTTADSDARATQSKKGRYNFLFILTDQERYFRPGELPQDYLLPAQARLASRRWESTGFVVSN